MRESPIYSLTRNQPNRKTFYDATRFNPVIIALHKWSRLYEKFAFEYRVTVGIADEYYRSRPTERQGRQETRTSAEAARGRVVGRTVDLKKRPFRRGRLSGGRRSTKKIIDTGHCVDAVTLQQFSRPSAWKIAPSVVLSTLFFPADTRPPLLHANSCSHGRRFIGILKSPGNPRCNYFIHALTRFLSRRRR